MKFLNFFKQIDWSLIIPSVLLTGLGLAAIFGVSDDLLVFKK